MNMLDQAVNIESEGMRFYTDLSEKTADRGIAGIFGFFAREEKRHCEIFEAWKKNVVAPDIDDTGLLGKADQVFRTISVHFKTDGVPAINHGDAYKKALVLEEKSISFYNEISGRIDDEEQKTVLKLIIHQEHAHIKLINQLMEFQRHPGEWLENAEWNHREEY
jgi:rubrerythrin